MKRKSLSTIVFEALNERIHSGALAPGAQLPTEADLCAEFDVSRTVVREAVARLRSEGLVLPRQGKGVFVNEEPVGRGFEISPEALRTLSDTIALLELRLAIETEAAGHAALRRTEVQAREIRAEMERADAIHPEPSETQIHYDYDFHLAIGAAAGNPYISDFLRYLRPILVPRFKLGYVVAGELKDRYFDTIHAEHEEIVAAIERRDAPAARAAMRSHLENSLDRLRALARTGGASRPADALHDIGLIGQPRA